MTADGPPLNVPRGGIAVVASNDRGVNLHGNADFLVLTLTVSEPGLYIVFARVVITNDDDDTQSASARISHGEDSVIDRVDLTMPRGFLTGMSISLQGTLRMDPNVPKQVNLRCVTFKGGAGQSSIIAVQVSDFKFS
jgi:hypothetical protein